MRATVMHKAGDVRVENVPDPSIQAPTDAVIRITRACVCGSDLWPYNDLPHTPEGRIMGHEAIGIVEETGAYVRAVKRGQLVVMPFAFSDGTCMFCDEGLHTSCTHGGFFGNGGGIGGTQAEALRIPQADGTLFALPVGPDDALLPSLLTLSEVMGPDTTRPSARRCAPAAVSRWSATGRSASAASSPRGGSAPSRSSSWAAIVTASSSRSGSARPTR